MAIAHNTHQVTKPAPERSPAWAVALAVLITVGINAAIPYTQHYMRTISLVEGMIPMGVFMPFLVLVFIANPILRAWGIGLRPWELVFVFGVGYVSVHITELLGRVLATYSVMHYMATPENLWEEYAFGVVKPWLVVENAGEYLAWFYEGLPRNAHIPWDIWLKPTFWWLSFIGAIGVGSVAIATLLRRQWVEQERLSFPFAQVIEELSEAAGAKGFPDYMKQPLFWMGVSIPAFIVLWYIIGYFSPGFPVITVGIENYNIHLGRYVPSLHGRINFLIIGFAYFTDLQILFSIWVFWALTWLQMGMTNRLGIAEGLGAFGGTREQALGGFIAFCLWGLWIARNHLKTVFQQAFSGVQHIDDRRELMSYRTAVFVFLACLIYMILWLYRGGMSPVWAVLVAVFWFVFYIGFAKIVAMTGLVFVESPALGTGIMALAPPNSLEPGTIAMRQLVGSTYQNGKCFTMPGATHAARLGEHMGPRARVMGLAIIFAFLFSLIAAAISTIYLGYQDGAFNFASYEFRVAAPRYYDGIVTSIRDIDKDAHYGLRMAYTAFGAAIMGVLTLCQYRFTWWPLHPIGFTVVTFYSTRTAIVSVFLTWMVKLVILRFGGIAMFRKAKPFFIGMIAGYAMALLVSLIVDLIWFPGQGHYVFWGD